MVDVDIGTEHLRWMGDTRFLVGMVKGMLQSPVFKCRIRMKVEESDKIEMARRAREKVQEQGDKMERMLHATENGEPVNGSETQTEGGGNANGKANANGDSNGTSGHTEGPIPKPGRLEPDDTWITIESTSKRIISGKDRLPKQSPNGHGMDRGGWVDGDAMLYV